MAFTAVSDLNSQEMKRYICVTHPRSLKSDMSDILLLFHMPSCINFNCEYEICTSDSDEFYDCSFLNCESV
jgi:hypothetical protein